MRILELRAENVKRLSVVQITPQGHLVQITGANGQGKSSVLDAIWMVLGGNDAVPDKPVRKGAKSAHIELKLGDDAGPTLIVERRFNTDGKTQPAVTVRSAEGARFSSPQQMLNKLMGAIGFDPLHFMRLKPGEQFEMLRHMVKMDVDLDALDRTRAGLYDERTDLNRQLSSAKARAAAITVPDGLPDEPPQQNVLVERMSSAAEQNDKASQEQRRRDRTREEKNRALGEVIRVESELERAKSVVEHWDAEISKFADTPMPEVVDVTALRAEFDKNEVVLDGFRKQVAKIESEAEATTLERASNDKSAAIDEIDARKRKAVAEAKMPIDGLSFEDGAVTFNGLPLAQASASQQLRVSAAIGAALNPQLRVILARDGSLLDSKSLVALAEFAEEKDMQIFLERVDESGEVGIVMEDGHVKGQEALVEEHTKKEAAAGEATTEPDAQALERAQQFLTQQMEMLPTRATVVELDKDNATVKTKLSRFPALIATQWTPAYLERVKVLTRKK